MIAESLARRYAVALFNLSKDRNEVEQTNEELNVLTELINANDNFRYFLNSPKVEINEKKDVFKSIFGDKFSITMMHFVYLLFDKKRQTLIPKMQSNFETLYNNSLNKAVIKVRPAAKLDDSTLAELKKVFEKKLNKAIQIQEEVDPSLIGGMQVWVDNTVYDTSVSSKLKKIQKVLIAG